MTGYIYQYRRSLPAFVQAALIVACAVAVAACTVAPPRNPDNLCEIFREKDNWYDAANAARQRWGTPIHVQMAIVYQESGYREHARPARMWLLWVIPWRRPSSAYGYAQALDSTWDWYQAESGNGWADRDDFDDAIDFVAWYVDQTHRQVGVSRWDAYNQYLAYYEGATGFQRRNYAGKAWLLRAAGRVNARAERYARQLNSCRAELESGWWPF